MNVEPISEQSNKGCGVVAGLLFGGIFFFAGLFFFWGVFLSPVLRTMGSDDWVQAPCTIISSKVDVDRDSDGTTYRPKIEFEYTIDRMSRVSEEYDFTALNRSQKRCREIVAANPVGKQTMCFVDPDNHDDAVIVRDYDFSIFGLLFPLVFALIGLAVMLSPILFGGKKSDAISGAAKALSDDPASGMAVSSFTGDSSSVSDSLHPADFEDKSWDEPQKLKPSQKRMTVFLITLGMAAFWNGIVGVFIYGIITDVLKDGMAIFPLLFMVPFVLVGIALLIGALYTFAAIFNPTVELALSTGAIDRGGTVDIAWQLEGRTSSIKSLKVTVEGEESATYRRGTDTITATNIFCTIPIAEVTDPQDIEFGSESFTIPVNTMHTFAADRNQIAWRIVVHGDIPIWPDVKETYEFRVKP